MGGHRVEELQGMLVFRTLHILASTLERSSNV